MKRFLFFLLPKFLRTNISKIVTLKNEITKDNWLMSQDFELEEKHLKHLKVLPNRLLLLEQLPKRSVVVEIGVAEGYFSERILEITEPKKLILIDLWESENPKYSQKSLVRIKEKFSEQIANNQVEIKRGWSDKKISELEKNSIDWSYIDAGHYYEDVKKDLIALKDKMKAGGIICGHDYIRWSGPTHRFGVVEAVNEFCLKNDFEMIFLTHEQNRHLSFAIRRIGE